MSDATAPVVSAWTKPFREVGEVEVLYIDLAPDEGRETEALAMLDDRELERSNAMRNLDSRRRFVLCRAALRAIVAQRLGVANERLSFAPATHGKPFALMDASPMDIAFNVSHSGSHGLIALSSRGLVGVDVEEIVPRHNLDGLINRVCSGNEQDYLSGLEQDQRLRQFLRLWTLKEALVKAHGQGISLTALADLEIPEAMRQGAISSSCKLPIAQDVPWHLEDLGTQQFAAALAYGDGGPRT